MKYELHIFASFDSNLHGIFTLIDKRECRIGVGGSSKIRFGVTGAFPSISTTFAFPTAIYY